MEIIKDLVQTLIIIVVLAVFLEMLLPDGKMSPYVKMVSGLLIIIAVLHAITGLVQTDWFHNVPRITPETGAVEGPPLEEIIAVGKDMQSRDRELAVDKYEEGLTRQVTALAQMQTGISVVECRVKTCREQESPDYGKIEHIYLTAGPEESDGGNNNPGSVKEIPPVKIGTGETGDNFAGTGDRLPSELKKPVSEVKKSIANFYNLSFDQITVNFREK